MILWFSIWILAIQIINRVLPGLLLTVSSLCYPNYCIFSRKVHTFSQKWWTKSEICQETSAETKSGDTGLSNGTSPTSKLPRNTENGRFEVWNLDFSGFTWFATQLTHIHRFMYCGMLSKLTKLSKAMKHRFWFTCWFSKPSFSLLRRSFQVGLVPLESPVSPLLFSKLFSWYCSLFGYSFWLNVWTLLQRKQQFG